MFLVPFLLLTGEVPDGQPRPKRQVSTALFWPFGLYWPIYLFWLISLLVYFGPLAYFG